MFGNYKRNSGFTLIEIMLTIVVLGLGAMLLVRGLTTGTSADVDTENRVIALNLCIEKLEELKSLNFNDPQLSAGTHTEDRFVLGFDSDEETRDWRREWVVSSYQGSSLNELKDVRIRVSWLHKGETTRLTVELESLIVNLIWAGT